MTKQELLNNATKPLFAEERKLQILEIINNNQNIAVPALCAYFDVSASTIRNDLRELEEENLIRRTHGGAISNKKVNLELLPAEKETHNLKEKEAIAYAAAALIENGDTIAISTGTTTFELVKKIIQKKRLTIVLNDIRIASFLEQNSDFTLFMLGGIIRKGFHYVNTTGMKLPNISIDKTFYSCNCLNLAKGATVPDFHLASHVRSLIDMSSENILLCDSSKVGSVAFAQIAPLNKINAIVIDDKVNEDQLATLQTQKSCNIILAPFKNGV